MTLNDVDLFKYGLRIVGLVIDTQHPDHQFIELFKRLLDLLR